MTVEGIQTTNAGKLFYPQDGITKGDLVEHYRRVADVMLPHLRGRPLTLLRYPDGIDGEGWFQKAAPEYLPGWIHTENIQQSDERDGKLRYVVCDDAATLVYLANQATIEFHIWASALPDLSRPDLLILDLDPPVDTDIVKIRTLARRVRELFESIGLRAYLQATGGQGFHILAPLDCSADFAAVRALAVAVADRLVRADPDTLTTKHRKNMRGRKIFLDTNRNGYGQTFAAPYTVRARRGAAVATPLDWSELRKAYPNSWDMRRQHARLAHKADPWRALHAHGASADRAHERLAELP
ncbi:MAG: non-homologous end-joining DNA ligase [Sciscionella sp.]